MRCSASFFNPVETRYSVNPVETRYSVNPVETRYSASVLFLIGDKCAIALLYRDPEAIPWNL